MIQLLLLILAFILPFLCGYYFVSLFIDQKFLSRNLHFSLGLGAGLGILSQWMLLLGVFGLPLIFWTISPGLVIFTAIFIKLRVKTKVSSKKPYPFIRNPLFYLAWAYLLYSFYYIFWHQFNVPLFEWDPIATSTFKAKVMFYEQSMKCFPRFPHSAYPLHVPFLQVWVACVLNIFDESGIRLFFPFASICMILVCYEFFKFYTTRMWAVFGCVLLTLSPLFMYWSITIYRDCFLMYYSCCGFLLLLLWLRTNCKGFLWLASFFMGFATFVKVEGMIYLGIFMIVFFGLVILRSQGKQRFLQLKRSIKYALPAMGIFGFFVIFRLVSGISYEQKANVVISLSCLNRVIPIMESFSANFLTSRDWNLISFLLVISLYLNRWFLYKKTSLILLYVVIVLHIVALGLLGIFTESYIWLAGSQAYTTLGRLSLHFYPLAVVLFILLNASWRDDLAEK